MTIKLLINKIESLLEYLLLVIIIFGNYSMVERDTMYNISETTLSLVFCAICMLLMIIKLLQDFRKVKKANIYSVILILLISIGMVLIPRYNIDSGFFKWIIPIFACAVYFLTNKNTKIIWTKYVNVVLIFAIISLILYISGSMLHLISPTRVATFLYDQRYRTCNTYFGLQYESQAIQGTDFFSTVYRNCGIFIESPMYNIILCIAFAAELSFRKKPRKIPLVILVITILSTYSTTGVLFLVFILVLRVITAGKGRQVQTLKILILPLGLLLMFYFALSLIEAKTKSLGGSISYSVRYDHIIACLKMWIDKPLFGHGYGNTDAFYNYTKYQQGLSVGLPALLGRNGLLIFLTYFVPFLKRIIYSFRKSRKQLYFWVGTFFCFFMTASIYKTIFIFLLCSQLLWNEISDEKESEVKV